MARGESSIVLATAAPVIIPSTREKTWRDLCYFPDSLSLARNDVNGAYRAAWKFLTVFCNTSALSLSPQPATVRVCSFMSMLIHRETT